MKERQVRWALETAEQFLADSKKTDDKDAAENCYFLARVWLMVAKRRLLGDQE